MVFDQLVAQKTIDHSRDPCRAYLFCLAGEQQMPPLKTPLICHRKLGIRSWLHPQIQQTVIPYKPQQTSTSLQGPTAMTTAIVVALPVIVDAGPGHPTGDRLQVPCRKGMDGWLSGICGMALDLMISYVLWPLMEIGSSMLVLGSGYEYCCGSQVIIDAVGRTRLQHCTEYSGAIDSCKEGLVRYSERK